MKRKRFPIRKSDLAAKPIFPDDPQSSAALPHNFVNPDGEAIGPADYFLNHSGLKDKNLIAALESVGLSPILDTDGKVTGATSKPQYKFTFTKFKTTRSTDDPIVTTSPLYPQFGGSVRLPDANDPPRKDPEVLNFDHKRKIELEKE